MLVSRASCDGRCGRFPRCWCRLLHCRPSSSPASSGSTDSEGIDGPTGVSPGEGGGIVSRRHPSPGGRAGSPWSASRARIRGLSIVLGSPFPSDGSSHQARGGVAPLVGDRGDPAATATGLPPVSSYVPTPHAGAASAHLSPLPTADPKPPLGPSGLGLPARRRGRYRTAARLGCRHLHFTVARWWARFRCWVRPIACLPLLDFRLPPRQLDVAPLREVRGVRIACGQLEARAGHGKIANGRSRPRAAKSGWSSVVPTRTVF